MARLGFLALNKVGEAGGELSARGNAAVPEPSMKTVNPNASDLRNNIDPPGLTPADIQDNEFTRSIDDADTYGPDGTRTMQAPLTPGLWQERRVMLAQRANMGLNWTPAASNDNADPQRGGSPGGGDKTNYTSENIITSQGPDGVTRVNAVPPSPLKLSYGWSDWMSHLPTFVGAHLKIQWNANPNKPQLNPTPFNTEGPSQNTRYSTPAPFAQGTFIG